jgi:hypothetical protein
MNRVVVGGVVFTYLENAAADRNPPHLRIECNGQVPFSSSRTLSSTYLSVLLQLSILLTGTLLTNQTTYRMFLLDWWYTALASLGMSTLVLCWCWCSYRCCCCMYGMFKILLPSRCRTGSTFETSHVLSLPPSFSSL